MKHYRNVGSSECACCDSTSEDYTNDLERWLETTDTCNQIAWLMTDPPIQTSKKDLIRHAWNTKDLEI